LSGQTGGGTRLVNIPSITLSLIGTQSSISDSRNVQDASRVTGTECRSREVLVCQKCRSLKIRWSKGADRPAQVQYAQLSAAGANCLHNSITTSFTARKIKMS